MISPWGTATAVLLATLLCGASARAAGSEESAALTVLDLGIARYKESDLNTALQFFRKAQQLAPERANPYRWMGLTLARLGRCAEAIEPLERFLTMVPTGDKRHMEVATVRDGCRAAGSEAERKVEEAAAARREPDPAPVGGPEAPKAGPRAEGVSAGAVSRPWHRNPPAWALLACGLVVAGGGAVMFGIAPTTADQARAAGSEHEWVSLGQRARVFEGVGIGGLAVGGAAIVAGIVWLSARRASPPSTRAWLAPGAGGWILGGAF